jgi:thiamine-phosphate pyrophosphorylase
MNQKICFEIKKFSCPPVFFTDRKKISDFEKIIKNLPKNSAIIIREYDLTKIEREIFAKKIIDLAKPRTLKILIGKDFALAKKLKADGVHFSDRDHLPLQFLNKKSAPKKFIFSISCHNLKSVLKSLKLKPDMIFISPIFPTTSHSDAEILGLRNLAKISSKTKKRGYLFGLTSAPIYALGGINSDNIQSVRKLQISGFGAIDFFSGHL